MSGKHPTGKGRNKQEKEVNCFSCVHFFITYESDFPYGCRAVGFKSRTLPSKVMFAHSGIECQVFEEKPDKKSQ